MADGWIDLLADGWIDGWSIRKKNVDKVESSCQVV